MRYVYKSSTGWDVNLYWPKGWLPPAVNRLNMIANGEFGDALGAMKTPQVSRTAFSYQAFGGVLQTPMAAYVPAGPKREQEKDDNYYRFQDEYGPLERLYDDEVIDEQEFESRLRLLKLKYNQT